jgi:aldehyde:ferredoxin oxidoreductase
MFGYHGNYLRIDVSDGSTRREVLDESVLRRFLGGSGLGAYIMLREGAPEKDALAPSAPLAFVFSPLVGSPLTTSAKFAVVGKSPLTGRINDSLASSRFAIAGKMTGSDGLVIVGRAESPQVLVIDDDHVRLDSAAALVGADCGRTEAELTRRYGSDYSVAVIGPAGERMVPFATISHDGRHAGRGGSGAVLGAKQIKALVVRGSKRAEWARPGDLMELSKQLSKRSLGAATAKYRELGTSSNLLVFNRLKSLPTRNFQQGSFEGAEDLSPETISTTHNRTRSSCAACTIGCEHIYELDGRDQGVRLEYENLFALGPLVGVADVDVVLEASKRCDEYGLDTISTGGTIGFAMECAERGWLDADWLRFGRGDALLRAIDAIASGEGLGQQLALGSRELARSLGAEAMEIAPQVKGLEIPGYEPRALQSMALGLAVGTRGADHNRSNAYEIDFSDRADRHKLTPASAAMAVGTEDRAALLDSLILCKFLRGVFEDLYAESAELVTLVTGWDVTADELRRTAARIVCVKKLFNIRAGWTPHEDTLPARFLQDPLADDPAARLSGDQLAAAIDSYNRERGWTPEGWIPDEWLQAMELDNPECGIQSSECGTPHSALRIPH